MAPEATLVNVRAGQDSGYFFLQPTVDALTYAGDAGIDVVNMSFYIDPWLYNCAANPADSPAEQAEQRHDHRGDARALDYAHQHGVTLVAAAGNERDRPRPRRRRHHQPGLPARHRAHPRTVDNDCLDLPTEGQNVISVSSVGPSDDQGRLLELRLRARSPSRPPAADFRDYFGTPAVPRRRRT